MDIDIAKLGSSLDTEDPELPLNEVQQAVEATVTVEDFRNCSLSNRVKKNSTPRINLHEIDQRGKEIEKIRDIDGNKVIGEIKQGHEGEEIGEIKRLSTASGAAALSKSVLESVQSELMQAMMDRFSEMANFIHKKMCPCCEEPEKNGEVKDNVEIKKISKPFCKTVFSKPLTDLIDSNEHIKAKVQQFSDLVNDIMKKDWDRVGEDEPAHRHRHGPGVPPDVNMQEPREVRINPMIINLKLEHLLGLMHAHSCSHMEVVFRIRQIKECKMPLCKVMKRVLKHMQDCKNRVNCRYPRCASSRRLIYHFRNCRKDTCPICKPFIKRTLACYNNRVQR